MSSQTGSLSIFEVSSTTATQVCHGGSEGFRRRSKSWFCVGHVSILPDNSACDRSPSVGKRPVQMGDIEMLKPRLKRPLLGIALGIAAFGVLTKTETSAMEPNEPPFVKYAPQPRPLDATLVRTLLRETSETLPDRSIESSYYSGIPGAIFALRSKQILPGRRVPTHRRHEGSISAGAHGAQGRDRHACEGHRVADVSNKMHTGDHKRLSIDPEYRRQSKLSLCGGVDARLERAVIFCRCKFRL